MALLRLFVVGLTWMFIFASTAIAQVDPASTRPQPPDRTPQYAPGQILVRYKSASVSAARVNQRAGAQTLQSYSIVPNLQLVQLQPGVKFQDALAAYRRDPSVLYAEPNYLRKALDTPNDPYFRDLWGLHNIGQPILFPYSTPPAGRPSTGTAGDDIHAADAWTITTGSKDVVVGVIDTGIDYNHEDLAANMYTNAADCNNNGVDDDGNGYVDDCHGTSVLPTSPDLMDQVGHGTHVSGTIGAVGNNNIGVAGVNWNVTIVGCKFLDWYGGYDSGAIACLDYIAKLKDSGVNIVATNNSWGGSGYSQALYDAIDEQRQRGILFVAAAGNAASDNDGTYPLYPGAYPLANIIAVAATSYDDTLAYFSNTGAHTVHLGAPGEYILSTTPNDTYSVYSGTSMATPHVTGTAALLKAQDPTRDWRAIKNLILAGADPLPATVDTITGGRLNVYRSMTCNNITKFARLQPARNAVLASSGQPLTVSAMNINCGSGAGPVQVGISPASQSLSLADDGNAPDQVAGDGIYSGAFTPSTAGLYTVTFPAGAPLLVAADPYVSESASLSYRTFTGTKLNITDASVSCITGACSSADWIDSPFPLSVAGGAYNGIEVYSSGVASVDSWVSSMPTALPYKYATTLFAPYWDDLLPSTNGGGVYWTINGTAPNRELVIEWRNMAHRGCATDGSASVTFQMVLFENTPDVLFNYKKAAFGGNCTTYDNGATAAVGVQSASTVAMSYSFQQPALGDNTALHWKTTLPNNLAPSITKLNPTSWAADIFDYFVEVTGANFGDNPVALVNGVPRTTYVLSSGDLYVDLTPADLSQAGTLQISVFNGLPQGGPSATAPFTVRADDFVLYLSAPSVAIKSGQSGQVHVYVNGNPVFYDGVTLSCSNLPSSMACTFDPGRILAGGYAVLTIGPKTNSSAAAVFARTEAAPRHPRLWLAFACFPFAAVLLGGAKWRARLLAGILLLLILTYAGCGGAPSVPATTSSNPGTSTSSGTSGSNTTTMTSANITVVGSSNGTQHSAPLSITVTP